MIQSIFFTKKIDEIRSLTPRIKSKIVDTLRKVGQYCFYKYNNDLVIDLVEKNNYRTQSQFKEKKSYRFEIRYIVENSPKPKLIYQIQNVVGVLKSNKIINKRLNITKNIGRIFCSLVEHREFV